MKKLILNLMQRYGEIMVYGNPFNESAFFFSKKFCRLQK